MDQSYYSFNVGIGAGLGASNDLIASTIDTREDFAAYVRSCFAVGREVRRRFELDTCPAEYWRGFYTGICGTWDRWHGFDMSDEVK